jgi:hypothetical protein
VSTGVCPDSGWVRAWVTGVCRFLVAADVRGGRVVGSGTGRSPAPPEASLRRLAGCPMMGRRETGAGVMRRLSGCVFRSVPWSGLAGGSAAGCIHPFACPGQAGCAWAVRVCAGGQAGSIKTPPAPPMVAAGQKTGRPRAWPLARKAPHAAPAGSTSGRARPGSGSARRASRSRPGSAAARGGDHP